MAADEKAQTGSTVQFPGAKYAGHRSCVTVKSPRWFEEKKFCSVIPAHRTHAPFHVWVWDFVSEFLKGKEEKELGRRGRRMEDPIIPAVCYVCPYAISSSKSVISNGVILGIPKHSREG